jgi:hypothetical protein
MEHLPMEYAMKETVFEIAEKAGIPHRYTLIYYDVMWTSLHHYMLLEDYHAKFIERLKRDLWGVKELLDKEGKTNVIDFWIAVHEFKE